MTQRQLANLSASVHQRLLDLSQRRAEEFNRVLTLFAIERLLYRLAQSPDARRFILKGALLFMVWEVPTPRPTRDLDLLGFGDNSPSALAQLFQAICVLPVPEDGLIFDAQSVRVSTIREDQEYQGQRVVLTARLGQARLSLQIDIGFGDAVFPAPIETTYPTLLEFPPPRLRIYPKESVVAEKLHAMVVLDLTNSRMKDFYDIWTLSRLFSFDSVALTQAIQATFDRRKTAIPMIMPTALTPEFAYHPTKVSQWQAFLKRNQLDIGEVSFAQIIDDLQIFLSLPLQALAQATHFSASWTVRDKWVVATKL
jgi:predicted nucleotidyltransferase component of viral defense system